MSAVGSCLTGPVLWTVVGCLLLVGLAAASGIVRVLNHLMAPESEGLIKAYRVPPEEASALRLRLFRERAKGLELMRRFDAAKQQAEHVLPRLVKLTVFADQLVAEHEVRNAAIAGALAEAVERLLQTAASGALEPGEREKVLEAIERFEREREAAGASAQ